MGLVAALEWLGKPYRLCRVDMLGEMREPAYARINARHETPALITDDGRVLTETMAIAHWFAARDTERRISPDPLSADGDRMRQIMAFINSGFTGAFSPLWVALEMDPPRPAMQALMREFGTEAVVGRHDKLEAMVGGMLVLLGINALRKLFTAREIHAHSHEHDGVRPHTHIHLHKDKLSETGEKSHHRLSPRSVLIGMVHGLAGSAALMLLVLPTIASPYIALAYILIFGVGSIAGMMLMSFLIGLPFHFTANNFVQLNKAIRLCAGIFSLGLGMFIIYEKLLQT